VAGNTATQSGPDIRYFGDNVFIISVGGNLIQNLDTVPDGTFNKPKDIFGVNPLLASINANSDGFPVNVHPLQAGSPARNGGINANAVDPLTNSPLTTDARGAGFPRIADTTVDIGAFEDQRGNNSLVVTKNADTDDLVCDTDCSLREAVHQAGLNFGTDTITFAPNVFGTITLSGKIILIKNQMVNIVGYSKANILAISGANLSSHFGLSNATVSIYGMTLTNGKARVPNEIAAGSITGFNSNLKLDSVVISGNDAIGYGAIYLTGGSSQRITNSTISGNTADLCVGIAIENTTLFMANATVSGNSITNGGTGLGAVYGQDATLNIRNSTIAFNRISTGTSAGIKLNNTALNIGNTIVANNIAGANPDLELQTGSVDTFGGNLIGNVSGLLAFAFSETNDAVNVDPQLAALADNGGNVTTHSLMPNSPAINTGINSVAVDPFDNSVLTTDARGTGFSRIIGAAVDKGAFEVLAPTAAGVTVSGRVISGKRGIALATVYLTDQNGVTRTSTTDSNGYYRFEDVEAGGTYIFNVLSKGYLFTPQVITVNEQMDELNFVLSSKGKRAF
jgi:CSLREA domain-containing protein